MYQFLALAALVAVLSAVVTTLLVNAWTTRRARLRDRQCTDQTVAFLDEFRRANLQAMFEDHHTTANPAPPSSAEV